MDKKMNINNKEIHVVEWYGTGTPIIFIHGLTANARCWDFIAERLTPDYKLITYDLPGRGDSAKPADWGGIPEHAKDLATLIDQLQLKEAVIVGHSLGASIGSYFAAKYPDKLKKLILIDGGMNPDPNLIKVLKPSIDRLGQVFPTFNHYLQYMGTTPFFKDWNPYYDRYFYYDVVHHPNGSVSSKVSLETIRSDLQSFEELSINDLHQQITVPTLVLWAPEGLLTPGIFVLSKEKGEEIARIISNSRFVTISGAHHYNIIMKDQLVEEIKKFMING